MEGQVEFLVLGPFPDQGERGGGAGGSRSPRGDHRLESGRLGKQLLEVPAPFDIQKEVDRLLLERFAPAGVLVNEELATLQFHAAW
jgi:hypothetical protein